MSDEKKRNWFMRLGRMVVCLCLLGAIGVWVAKIWVLPPIVRSMARSHLRYVWFGTIEIDEVDVNIFGPSYVRGVTVRDNLGRTWLSVPEVRAEAAWDGLVPRLGGVRVGVVNVSPQFVDGKCTVPLKRPDDPDNIVTFINDLKEVEMTVGVVTLRTVNDVSPAGGAARSRPANRTLGGIVLPVELARAISQTNIIFPAIEWKGGKLSVDKARGEIGDDPIVVNLSGGLQPDRSITLSTEITGTLYGGKLQADVKTVLRPDVPVQLTLEASVEKVKMADLTRVLVPDKIMQKGTGRGVIRLSMSGSDPESISGRGAFFLDDADLWQVPILSALFKHMRLKLDKADIEGSFDLAGTTATTITGQLATMVWAAEFEKGGTVDFDSRKIDMYVLFLPIKQAGILLNLVKAINPLRLVAKEVFRLHVTGRVDDPRITPVPFSDLAKLSVGTLGLLKSVTASGGQLGGDIFKAILGGGK